MKTSVKLFLTFMFLGITSLFAQELKTETFKVYGNCDMCKDRIEKAAESVDGVTAADWNKETKMLEVSFDASKTDTKIIRKAIAKAGHDTLLEKAPDEVYAALPQCCHYKRAPKKSCFDEPGRHKSCCDKAGGHKSCKH